LFLFRNKILLELDELIKKPEQQKPLSLISSDRQRSRFSFKIGSYKIKEINIQGQTFSLIKHRDSRLLKKKGAPALPWFRSNVLIPHGANPSIRIVRITSKEINNISPPLPAAGFIPRIPASAPKSYLMGSVYSSDHPFPLNPVKLTDSYKIRNLQAIGLIITPFQYFPKEKKMLVYTDIEIEIIHDENPEPFINASFKSSDFLSYASNNFVNFKTAVRNFRSGTERSAESAQSANQERESILRESNKLLIIVPDAMSSAVNDFITWKKQRGIDVSVLTSFHEGLQEYEEMEGVKVYRKVNSGSNPEGLLSNLKTLFNNKLVLSISFRNIKSIISRFVMKIRI